MEFGKALAGKLDVGSGIEGDLLPAEQRQAARARPREQAGDPLDIGGLGLLAHQAEDAGLGRAVPRAGERERALQLHPHPLDARKVSRTLEMVDETLGDAHRADRVRA